MVAETNKKNFSQSTVKFFKEVKSELKKVTWPSRKTLISYTVVVLVTCFIIGVILGVADFGFSTIYKLITAN
jgi:preprotein translocase subunit SecE